MRRPVRPFLSVAAALLAVLTGGCSDGGEAQCVRSGEAKISYSRDDGASGSLDVSGLQPGSMLTVTSPAGRETTYRINAAGTLDGKAGFINGTGAPTHVSVSGITKTGDTLAATFRA